MAYGDLKVNNLIYDTGSGDASRSVVSIPLTASPTFTGTVTVPTPTAGDNSTKAATTAFVVASFATKASPTFTGTVVVPTATAGDNSTAAASTAFVATSFATKASPTFTGTPAAPTASANTNTTQIATTAFVMTELGDYLLTATAASTYAPLAAPAFTGTATGVNLTLSGNLTVNGTTTTIDTTNLDVEDKNITIGKVSTPSDTTADGGGITLKGASDKTFNWVDATDAWTSSEHIHVGDSKKLITGTGSDLQIFHDGSNSKIQNTQTGRLHIENSAGLIRTNTDSGFYIQSADGNTDHAVINSSSATFAGTVSDSKGDVRSIPSLAKSSAHTIAAANAGKAVYISTGGVTVPNSVMSAGDAVTIINNSGADQTITQGSGVTLHNSADASTGNRTLAARGMATVWFASASVGYISGAGLS
jgi:hypothetical protein